MKQTLLVGNGFTSQLIQEYANDCMMAIFKNEMRVLLDKANKLFEPLRYKVDSDSIKLILKQLGFSANYEQIFRNFFEEYGLVYETQQKHITSIENLLKIVRMFMKIGQFTESDFQQTRLLANKIYYNNGKFRAQNISESSRTALSKWLNTYQEIYTTNYDMILDDIYEQKVYHLHGGFQYKCRASQPLMNPVASDEAYLVWGISGEAKYEQMKAKGMAFPIHFPLVIEGSVLGGYLEALQKSTSEQIHIFGYSGENDQHINNAIVENSNIKEIIYYCSPEEASSNLNVKAYSINELFNRNKSKKTTLRSWDDVWSLIR